jgi:ribose/xylose/arabinose/galactoside ABC-type transport system permease subunit
MEPGIGNRGQAAAFFSKYGIYFAFTVLTAVMAVVSPPFRTLGNAENILQQISVNGIMAVGMTLVIITAGIDLSVGSVLALSAVVATSFAHPGGGPLIVPILLGMLAGLACGAVNGTLIAKKKLAPFIVTLGMMTVARGLALVYTNGRPVINLSDAYNAIGGGYLMAIPLPVLIFLGVILLGVFILHYTRFGRYVYAVGGQGFRRQHGPGADRRLCAGGRAGRTRGRGSFLARDVRFAGHGRRI